MKMTKYEKDIFDSWIHSIKMRLDDAFQSVLELEHFVKHECYVDERDENPCHLPMKESDK